MVTKKNMTIRNGKRVDLNAPKEEKVGGTPVPDYKAPEKGVIKRETGATTQIIGGPNAGIINSPEELARKEKLKQLIESQQQTIQPVQEGQPITDLAKEQFRQELEAGGSPIWQDPMQQQADVIGDVGAAGTAALGVGALGAAGVLGAEALAVSRLGALRNVKLAKTSVKSGFLSKIMKNKVVQGAIGYIGISQLLGSSSRRASDIESSVGKRGERISKLAELSTAGYPPEDILSALNKIEQEVALYESTLQVLRQRNPEMILNPEAMDSAFAEVEKIKVELMSAKLKTLNAAANPLPENSEALQLFLEDMDIGIEDLI